MDYPRIVPPSPLSQKLPHVVGYQCVICGQQYSLDEVTYTCPTCGDVGTLDVLYRQDAHRYESSERPLSFWQQLDLLPIDVDAPLPLRHLGNTPLLHPEALTRLAKQVGVGALYIKNDGLNLT